MLNSRPSATLSDITHSDISEPFTALERFGTEAKLIESNLTNTIQFIRSYLWPFKHLPVSPAQSVFFPLAFISCNFSQPEVTMGFDEPVVGVSNKTCIASSPSKETNFQSTGVSSVHVGCSAKQRSVIIARQIYSCRGSSPAWKGETHKPSCLAVFGTDITSHITFPSVSLVLWSWFIVANNGLWTNTNLN